jgi:hypothetical protein
MAEKDPYGFLAFVLADIDGRWKDALAHRPRQRPPLAAQAPPRPSSLGRLGEVAIESPAVVE